MPTSLSVLPNISRKNLRLTALLLLSPLFFWGQSLTGLWTGALSNDSTTVRKDQSFEIALTEYLGKVYGFSRSEFIVDDTLYYVVKRVKGTIEGDLCEVVDDEIISYNFRGKLDKGIKVTSIFRKNKNDSTWYLEGTWKTNATKKYYAVSGKVNLAEEKDLNASKIFPHLEELKLANDVAFYKERKEGTPIARMAKPEKIKTEYSTKIDLLTDANNVVVSPATPDLERAETIPPVVAVSKPTIDLPKTDTKIIAASRVNIIPAASTKIIAENKVPDEEVAAVIKPLLELPKTDTKVIPATTVIVSPASTTKTIAENKVTDEEVVAVIKPLLELPKTDTKIIPATTVAVLPTSTTKTKVENKIPEVTITAGKITTTVMIERGAADKDIPAVTVAKANIKKENLPVVSNNKPTNVSTPVTDNNIVKPEPVAKIIAKQETVVVKQSENNTTKTQGDIKSVDKTTSPITSVQAKPATETKKTEVVSTRHLVTNNTIPENKEIKTEPVAVASVIPEEKKPAVNIISRSGLVAGRKTEFSQIVSFKSDSLELSLYDNGEVDGDTVSIFMNGEVIMSKQGLKASAIKKTIYITRANEDFTLVLFAENLGKYPPNTGLLVVHDGEDVYNLRFSSDFQKNTGIVFRRKK